MRAHSGRVLRIATIVLVLGGPATARADETDNFTCRGRLTTDAQDALDGWINARILEAVGRANRRGPGACDEGCLVGELRKGIGGSRRHALTWVPHARFASWIADQPDIDRCRLPFRASVYGARPYNQPWLFPFTGRIIFLADSIRLSGRVVGIDKINHFIREGQAHWKDVARGGDVEDVMRRALGSPRRPFRMTEYGLQGMALTGVLSYADLAASYSGYRFWEDILSLRASGSFVARDAAANTYIVRRTFAFRDYVNDAWDEGINPSRFHPRLATEVEKALRRRAMRDPAAGCGALAQLPEARIYVNPVCLR